MYILVEWFLKATVLNNTIEFCPNFTFIPHLNDLITINILKLIERIESILNNIRTVAYITADIWSL